MRLIDADALYKDICDGIDQMANAGIAVDAEYLWGKLKDALDNAPTTEPKRGEWIVHEARTEVNDGFIDFSPTEYECSNCGLKQSMYFINSKPSNFCPNCGADMREESE